MGNPNDTIVALASGDLPAGIAIVRISGSLCRDVLDFLSVKVPDQRKLTVCNLVDPDNGQIIDQCMVFHTVAPYSFTGEDTVEFQVHGSRAIVQKLLNTLLLLDGLRLAAPGEFSRRAFDNGRLDLSEVEGLGDLLLAETEGQRQQAISRYCGGLSSVVGEWREQLVLLLSLVEANIDFSDEEDVGVFNAPELIASLHRLKVSFEQKLSGYSYGQIVRKGFRVGIVGLPNVGKSSIINALTRSNRAIVTDEAGTTRDIQELQVDIEGRLFLLLDSAGIRHSSSKAEQEGVRRSYEMMDACDLIVWVCAPDVKNSEVLPTVANPLIHIWNKADLSATGRSGAQICAKSGDVKVLEKLLCEQYDALRPSCESVFISRQRDKVALEAGIKGIKGAIEQLEKGPDLMSQELLAEDIRHVIFILARFLGHVDAEDVLGRVFSGFCIGK